MKKKWIYSAIFCFCLLQAFPSQATRFLGGEITYRCLGNGGLFEFTVVVYRDCGDSTTAFSANTITLRGPHGQTTLELVGSTDVSPRCISNTTFRCNPPSSGQGSQGAVSRFVYRGIVGLSGVPAPPVNTGHTFWVELSCCRSVAIVNSLAGNASQALVARMFRYIDPITGNALTPAQLCDASPVFQSELSGLFVQNPFDTVVVLASANDANPVDSIAYGPGSPLNQQRLPIAYALPFSLSNPLPGLLGPPLVAAVNSPVHPQTGEIIFRPNSLGIFAFGVTVTSYRNGQKIAEILRDAFIQIIPNPQDAPPPFIPDTSQIHHRFSQRAPVIQPPVRAANGQSVWEVQGYASLDTLVANMEVTDLFPGLQGDPSFPQTWQSFQSPFVTAVSSSQLSTNNQATGGCDLPPCATLRNISDPNPPATNFTAPMGLVRGNGQFFGRGYQATGSGGIKLVFAPTLVHLGATGAAGSVPKSYAFQVAALDRNCPLEGEARRVVQLTVKPFAPYIRPVFDSIALQQGRNRLHFWSGLDTLSIDSVDLANFSGPLSPSNQQALLLKSIARRERAFAGLRIYKGLTPTGPFQLLATITNPRQRTFTDTSLLPGHFYYLETLSGRPLQSRLSADTLAGCTLGTLQVSSAQSRWLCEPGASIQLSASLTGGSYRYQWYRNQAVLSGQNSSNITVSDTGSYQVVVFDSLLGCFGTSPAFRVRRGLPFGNEQLCAVTVDTLTGRNLILWNKTPDMGTAFYVVLRERFTTGVYDTLARIPFETGGAYLDTAVNADIAAWKYALQLEDSCGRPSTISPVHRSIHLRVAPGRQHEVELNWTAYEGRPIGMQRIMSSHNGSPFTLVATVSPTTRTFTNIFAQPGPKAYYIAIGSAADCDSSAGVSYPAGTTSNIALIGAGVGLTWLDQHQAVVYPNPGTGLFRAGWDVAALEEQELQLYNSYGQRVRTFRLQAGESTLEFDLQGEAPGVYVLRSTGSAWTERIVLLR